MIVRMALFCTSFGASIFSLAATVRAAETRGSARRLPTQGGGEALGVACYGLGDRKAWGTAHQQVQAADARVG
jgi:hypothetical protein